jgi:dUTP pyrophosphatase
LNVAPSIELRILDERLRTWGLPTYQSDQAAAIDLFACLDEPLVLAPQAPSVLVPTGLAMHMNTHDFCALVLPRSGLGHKRGLVMGNGTGVIDADYMAECFVSVWNRNPARIGDEGEDANIIIQPGDRIAQMLFVPVVRPAFAVVESFSSSSKRGLGGFGSTGVS